AFLIALRVIPPEKALRSPRTLFDDDYARLLSLLTLLGVGAVLLSVFLRKRLHLHTGIIQLIVNGLALSIPAIGFYRAFDLLQQLQLDVTVGGGAIFYAGILVIIAVRIIMPRATPAQEMTKSPIRASVFDR
ncbi:MAG TPA: hypothetical protein VJZ27_05725, partial [Aggregatilineales bacterium]|nr:hypothetical protein [Aggregatilineales bacterium]